MAVMLHQEKNKMSANNLGIVFGPSIMRNRSNTVDFSSTGHQSAATYAMIQYYDYIFANAVRNLERAWSRPLLLTPIRRSGRQRRLRPCSRPLDICL
jgi:hypothetical protein